VGQRHSLGRSRRPRRVDNDGQISVVARNRLEAVALPSGLLLEGAPSALPAAVHEENVAEIRKHADLLFDLPDHVG
jgi:hypothetical protein